jgi:hypothetical protein
MKEQEEADNTAEMYNNLTSDMLTENPDVAKSALGKNRLFTIIISSNPQVS